LIEDCDLRFTVVRSLRNTDRFSEVPNDSRHRNVFSVKLSTVYVSERVQIPAARFSEGWGNFFGLKMFARMRGFGGFSVRGKFVMRRREANENFLFLLRIAGGEP